MEATSDYTLDNGDELLDRLAARFTAHRDRHPHIEWASVLARLRRSDKALSILGEMERTGGEPDVIGYDADTDMLIFSDCSAESPAGRRSLCYDEPARASRKTNAPKGSAVGMAESMGVALMTEEEYFQLQRVGEFDTKTSSWLQTPADLRGRGGALFGDRRYGRVFVYHNGAQSYYAARGFRAILRA
jgi:pentatricopeptide repeat protein